MSDVIHSTPQDFWRPPSTLLEEPVPVPVQPAVPAMAEACPRCGTEFLLGSKFCHSCGGRRPEALNSATRRDEAGIASLWESAIARMTSLAAGVASHPVWSKIKLPGWLHYLHFHEIKRWVGLPTASLIAFVVGLGCVAGALSVGLLTARNLIDWQAIQFYRAEWLLAATASFVAGILLKKSSEN